MRIEKINRTTDIEVDVNDGYYCICPICGGKRLEKFDGECFDNKTVEIECYCEDCKTTMYAVYTLKFDHVYKWVEGNKE